MHPAPSLIVFTVLSGLGYGLAFVLCLGLLDPEFTATKLAWLTALVMIATGLVSSLFHLGNPRRAWRALSQWQSSWLSREGVMALATFAPLVGNMVLAVFAEERLVFLSLLGALMCAATVICTSMIYASLRSVEAWSTGLTPICFSFFALAGGGLIAIPFAALGSGMIEGVALLALAGLIGGTLFKLFWMQRLNAGLTATTPETATGLGSMGKVHLLERPHAMDNYLTREMVFRIGRKHARKLRAIAFILAAAVPLVCLLLIASTPSPLWLPLATVAIIAHCVGMLVERWLFFAEAGHAVANYYGA